MGCKILTQVCMGSSCGVKLLPNLALNCFKSSPLMLWLLFPRATHKTQNKPKVTGCHIPSPPANHEVHLAQSASVIALWQWHGQTSGASGPCRVRRGSVRAEHETYLSSSESHNEVLLPPSNRATLRMTAAWRRSWWKPHSLSLKLAKPLRNPTSPLLEVLPCLTYPINIESEVYLNTHSLTPKQNMMS